MSGYLLDTNCISELVRIQPEPLFCDATLELGWEEAVVAPNQHLDWNGRPLRKVARLRHRRGGRLPRLSG